MNILFAVQGTGNGHISRARAVLPHLKNYGNVEVLISGTQADVGLPQTDYQKKGISYVFGKNGGIDYWESVKIAHPIAFTRDVASFPIKKYDLIINDFEPITAMAAKLKGKKTVALSHQSAFLSPLTPRPTYIKDRMAEIVLKYYAPCTSAYAFHFEKYDSFINTPLIRDEIRAVEPSNTGHYTVYLPAYSDEVLIKELSQLPDVPFQIFSKHSKTAYKVKNISIEPIHNQKFNESLSACEGLLTGAGFEAPAEAMFLGKKVLVIPMQGQYEQHCNAVGAIKLGAAFAIKIDENFNKILTHWVYHTVAQQVHFPDETAEIIARLVKNES